VTVSIRTLVACSLFLFAMPVGAELRESRQTVESRAGVIQPFFLVEPAGAPAASVILFTGGEGVLGFKGAGPFPRGGNFLVRNRQAFAAHGLLVAVIEVPSDHAGGLGRFRLTEDHARDVAAVIAALRQRAPVPVWVIGTSLGTLSAVNAAVSLKENGPDGLVVTSSATRAGSGWGGGPGTIYDAGLDDVRVPTLVVHSENDACVGSPGSDARTLAGRVRAQRKELLLFNGAAGGSGNSACEPFSAHGYFGIDAEVVKAIADWIKGAS
jgi:pimeloyl-ACP methyl ester carboxylesterase